jgi:PadR family transcriptional regulator PadR
LPWLYLFSIREEMKHVLNDSDLMTLLAILRLGEQAYGVSLSRELSAMTGRAAALASVYRTLERLEACGLVTSRMGEPSPERGGRAKRFAEVTVEGMRAIDATRRLLNTLWKDVPVYGSARRGGA